MAGGNSGRNDRAIADAMQEMAQALQHQAQNNAGGDGEFRYLEKL